MNIYGSFREHSGNIQGIFSKHSVNIQGTFSEHSVNIYGSFSKHSGNIQGRDEAAAKAEMNAAYTGSDCICARILYSAELNVP
jgi:hypothetical protein